MQQRPPPPPRPPSGQPKHQSRPQRPPPSNNSPPKPKPTSTYFTEAMLPSCVKSGYKPEDERNTRRRTCRFLEEASRKLKLPRVAISTSMVFFHRFFAVHSFADHDRFEVAVACLLLAAKTEESPKKLKDVIQICWSIKTQSAKKSVSSKGGASPVVGTPEAKVDKAMFLDVKGEEYTKLKERTLLLERVVLHTIGFELSVDHPYKFLVDQVTTMVPNKQIEYMTSTAQTPNLGKLKQDMVQYAMNFANDSMHTTLCLQYPPNLIAAACVYMGGQYGKIRPTGGKKWVDILGNDLDMGTLASITIQILELIADKRGVDQSKFATIHADLEKMKKEYNIGADFSERKRPPMSGEVSDAKRPRVS